MGTPLPSRASVANKPGTAGAVRNGLGAIVDNLTGLFGTDGEAATALATLGSSLARHQALTAAATLTAADRGKFLSVSGSWALTLPLAATAQAGWSVVAFNTGTGEITLAAAGSDTINGGATLPAGWACIVVSTGTAWDVVMIPGAVATPSVRGLMSSTDKSRLDAIFQASVSALAGLTPAADKMAYFTGSSTAALTDLTPFARTLMDDADAVAMRATLGLSSAVLLSGINGAVAMDAAGVATGAVLEEGVTRHGRWIKFANGWMICTREAVLLGRCSTADGTAFKTGDVTWTFPAAFVAAPVVQGVAGDIDVAVRAGSASATAVKVRGQSMTSKAVILSAALSAVGRWSTVGVANPGGAGPRFWFDPTDLSTLFQDDAGTVPVTQPGDPVGRWLDKSGNGYHLTQPTATKRPTWQLDADGRASLAFDGVDDILTNAAVDFSAASAVTICVAVRRDALGVGMNVVELIGAFDANSTNSWRISATNPSDDYRLASTGSTAGVVFVPGGPAPVVLTLQASISGSYVTARRQGAVAANTTVSQGTGAYPNAKLHVGCRDNNTFRLNGRIYGLVGYGAALGAADVKAVEDFLNQRAGAF